MKRLLSCYPSEYQNYNRIELKQSIFASEGRIILGETVVTAAPLLEGVSNAEMMAAFGCDLLLLNEFDVFTRFINGFYENENPINEIKKITGRLIGINLEPVDDTAMMIDKKVNISSGRMASIKAVSEAEKQGVDFLLLTGNPSTGVTTMSIKESITIARENFSRLIFAGKMHGAGTQEDILNKKELLEYIDLGADGVIIPAVGTVPGVSEEDARIVTRAVKKKGGMVISTIGTSQESADSETIRDISLCNKRVGVDIHHIGDGGYGRMPTPENILKMSITVRGKRHTYFRIAQSILR